MAKAPVQQLLAHAAAKSKFAMAREIPWKKTQHGGMSTCNGAIGSASDENPSSESGPKLAASAWQSIEQPLRERALSHARNHAQPRSGRSRGRLIDRSSPP